MISQYHRPGLVTWLHSILISAWIIVGTAFFGLLAIFCSFFSKTGNSVHQVARLWGKSILWVSGLRVQVTGAEYLHSISACIYMSNHQSNFDIPVLLGKLPGQVRWLAKAELFKIPIFGRGMRGAGYISIDRSNRASAFQSLARAADTIHSGTSVLIFPEGTRSIDGRLQSFKKGGFVMAVDAQVPIVPIVIQGTQEVMPKGRLLIRRRPVNLVICPAIDTRAFTRKTKDTLMNQVHQVMQSVQAGKPQGGSRA